MSARHPQLLSPATTAVFVVDVQEAFRKHIDGFEPMVAAIDLLVRGAREIGVPVAYSEQYPQGLGRTVDELVEPLATSAMFEKIEISSRTAPGWESLPEAVRDAQQIVVVGIETHVCVSQTVHDMLAAGTQVHVPIDAVSSRAPAQRAAALDRLSRAGAVLTTVEMALFELLEKAGTPEFKAVQGLIKQYDAARLATHSGAGKVHA